MIFGQCLEYLEQPLLQAYARLDTFHFQLFLLHLQNPNSAACPGPMTLAASSRLSAWPGTLIRGTCSSDQKNTEFVQ